MSKHSTHLMPLPELIHPWYWRYTYLLLKFWYSGTDKWFQIEWRQDVFLWNLAVSGTHSPASGMPAHKPRYSVPVLVYDNDYEITVMENNISVYDIKTNIWIKLKHRHQAIWIIRLPFLQQCYITLTWQVIRLGLCFGQLCERLPWYISVCVEVIMIKIQRYYILWADEIYRCHSRLWK